MTHPSKPQKTPMTIKDLLQQQEEALDKAVLETGHNKVCLEVGCFDPLKDFLKASQSQLLEAVRKEIEGMEVERASVVNGELRTTQDGGSPLANEFSVKLAYNQALKDILSLLEENK